MGDKTDARKLAIECDVPVVPGTDEALLVTGPPPLLRLDLLVLLRLIISMDLEPCVAGVCSWVWWW